MAGEPPSPLALCAVVVDYHGEDLLRALLASLAEASRVAGAAVRLRVVVVDNGRDGRCAQLCAEAPLAVERIDPASNLGFGAGVNRGAAGATEPWLLVLNSDVSIPPSFLVQLGGLLRQLPADVVALGPALRNPDGSAQPSVGEFPNLARSLLALVQPRERRKYVSPAAHRAGPVDWVTGACLVLRRTRLRGARRLRPRLLPLLRGGGPPGPGAGAGLAHAFRAWARGDAYPPVCPAGARLAPRAGSALQPDAVVSPPSPALGAVGAGGVGDGLEPGRKHPPLDPGRAGRRFRGRTTRRASRASRSAGPGAAGAPGEGTRSREDWLRPTSVSTTRG